MTALFPVPARRLLVAGLAEFLELDCALHCRKSHKINMPRDVAYPVVTAAGLLIPILDVIGYLVIAACTTSLRSHPATSRSAVVRDLGWVQLSRT